jgi:hypothetical protein
MHTAQAVDDEPQESHQESPAAGLGFDFAFQPLDTSMLAGLGGALLTEANGSTLDAAPPSAPADNNSEHEEICAECFEPLPCHAPWCATGMEYE